MNDSGDPKLSPEAIKLLNEMAARRNSGVNLSPDAQANLEKLSNFHLTHTYQAHKNSYLIMALVLLGLGAGATLYGLNLIIADPVFAAEHLSGIFLLSLIPIGFTAGACRFWTLFKRI